MGSSSSVETASERIRRQALEKAQQDEEDLNAPMQRSIRDYDLKTGGLLAKQKYEDAQYASNPDRVRRARALEDSRLSLREGIMNKMKLSLDPNAATAAANADLEERRRRAYGVIPRASI